MLHVHHDPFAKSVLIALSHVLFLSLPQLSLFKVMEHWLDSVFYNTSQQKAEMQSWNMHPEILSMDITIRIGEVRVRTYRDKYSYIEMQIDKDRTYSDGDRKERGY